MENTCRLLVAIVIVLTLSCESRKRPGDSPTIPQLGDVPTRLFIQGPTTLNSAECIGFTLKTVDNLGAEKSTPVDISVVLSVLGESEFFLDSECSIQTGTVVVKGGSYSLPIYFRSLSVGDLTLRAVDANSKLGSADWKVTVLPVVDIIISNGPTYSFGSAYLGTTLEKTFTVSNSGDNPALSLGASALAVPFAFKDGQYPGTGGTCASTLSPGGRCSVVLAFTPQMLGQFSQSLVINFNDGVVNQSTSRALRGEGVTSGSLDAGFGQSGKVVTPGGNSEDRAMAVVMEPGGKVVIAGSSIRSGTSYDTTLVRYNGDGSLDPTFGIGGIAIQSLFATEDRALAIVRQSSGKWVIAGYALVGSTYDYLVARFNTDGTLDRTFGTDGKTTTSIGTSHDYAFAMARLSDDRIIVGGYSYDVATSRYNMALSKYTDDGVLDPSFGSSGKTTVSVGSGSSYCFGVVVQPSGKIIAVGYASVLSSDIAAVQFNADGTVDIAGFGTNGKTTIDINSSSDYGYAGALQSDGKILIAGSAHFGGGSDFAAVRLNADGTLDTSFDFDGKVYYAVGPSLDEARTVQQTNGRIVLAGSSYNGLDYDFSLLRLFSDGAMDTSFGSSGKLVTPVGAGSDRIFSSTIDSVGKIVVVGDSLSGSTLDFALAKYLP